MRVTREPSRYWSLGIAFSHGFGRTLVISAFRWKLMWHWRDPKMEALLRDAARLDEQERT